MSFVFSKHGLVVSGHNMMYMAGGEYPDGSASQAFMRYDPVLDLWQEMASLRTPRSELGRPFVNLSKSKLAGTCYSDLTLNSCK